MKSSQPDLEPRLLRTEVSEITGRVRSPWVFRWNWTDLGRWGEWIALRHLRKAGWDIIARNWKGKRGELDLVAFDGPFLVIVEAKTRRIPSYLPPEDQITSAKERKLDEVTTEFVLRHELTGYPVRIDIVTVETGNMRAYTLRHYRGWNAYQISGT